MSDAVTVVPYGEDPLQALAERLLADTAGDPCRLAETTVLIPDLEAAARLRRHLLAAQAGGALLGPRITTLRGWLEQHTAPLPPVLGAPARPLLLVEALRQHRRLFGDVNLWALADALLTLFDELTLAQTGIGPDADEFVARLSAAYGLPSGAEVTALGFEARVVHTLWHAWHQQLQARQRLDPAAAHLLRLAADRAQPNGAGAQRLYLAGFTDMAHAEVVWLRPRLETGHAYLFLHGSPAAASGYHPDAPVAALLHALGREAPAAADSDPLTALLEGALEPEGEPLLARAEAFRDAHPASPADGRLALFSADGAEQEAAAVELQIRRWLLAGHRRIGVVTENRRLARRLRALLERAGVALQDAAGWALSTTRAAAALERWLECMEEDFPHRAMLDLLKSPFVFPGENREPHLAAVYRLEQDVIRHEGIGQGLERYRHHLEYRLRRLGPAAHPASGAVSRLLEHLAAARDRFGGAAGTRPASQWLAALGASLEALGMAEALAADAAGARLLEELETLRRAAADEDPPLAWTEFRAWLGRTLEQAAFRPPGLGAAVVLLGLGQSRLSRFDALVIAGAEREHLPGAPHASPFFNDAVRSDLELKTGEQRRAERFHHFRRLLQAAPRVLITLRHAQDGEEVVPSPWVALLGAFHRLAYGRPLADNDLGALLGQPGTRVRPSTRPPLPSSSRRPAPTAPPALLPQEISASAYQQLVDCPYRFFAARCLGLSAPDEVREALEKSDYGQRVHRCLEAFHNDIEGLPGPFGGRLTAARKGEAIALLEHVAAAVFAQDLEDNFVHRGWLDRWREVIPAYVEWELRHQGAFDIERVEAELERLRPDFPPGIALRGRIDRLEQGAEGTAVVDYKTGYVPPAEAVESGESVQLPFYALLAEQPIVRSEYLQLDAAAARSRGTLAGEALNALAEANGDRLSTLYRALGEQAPMPAWGDATTCGFCDMGGVCRREVWAAGAADTGV